MSIFRSRAGSQALVVLAVGSLVCITSVKNQTFEHFAVFLNEFEEYHLDEIFLAASVVGLMSLVYSALRVWDLRQEIVRRTAAEGDVAWISTHDETTRLLNRRSLIDRMDMSVARDKSPLCIFSIGLNGFEKINDLLGHSAGDVALGQIAERLRDHFAYENIFSTTGGNFVALLDRSGDQVGLTAERIVSSISLPLRIGGQLVEISFSVGYALFPEDGKTVADVVRCADVAREAAKTEPCAHIRAFESVMQQTLRQRSILERQLREAIRAGTILPHYQPIVDLRTSRINGFEALARWETAPGQFVPPATFIELAEEIGLIAELTVQLFRQACADARDWPDDVILSFNLSPTQLHDGLLGVRLLSILLEVGLSPTRLEIEITESALVRDLGAAQRILSDLHNAHIRVALDDFGTGYSSLGQLSKFSFDKIKIDRSFVSAIGDRKKNEKILKAIIGLSKGLDILTTAEGIETEEQLRDLTAMGCNNGQGYLFGKAVPAKQALGLLIPDTERRQSRELLVS